MTRISSMTFVAIALALASAPAHAQLLGGGGLGGAVGGAIGGAGSIGAGSMGGGFGSMGSIGSATTQVESTSRAAANATGSTSGSQHVNARNGKVDANRSVTGSGTANLAPAATAATPLTGSRSVDGALSGSGSATGSGSADAQLVGTNQVSNTARAAASRANSTVGDARSTASTAASDAASRANGLATSTANRANNVATSAASRANGAASGVSATAQGTANGSLAAAGSLGSRNLALAGSAASNVAGSAAVKPGMTITAPDGSRLGKVRQVVADSNGRVQGVVMRVRNTDVNLPASNFAASGNGKSLISTMNGQQIENAAQGQTSAATR